MSESTTQTKSQKRRRSREQEEIGNCTGCGKFERCSEMGVMDDVGQVIWCKRCQKKNRGSTLAGWTEIICGT